MNTRVMWGIVVLLLLVIIALAWILFATPAPVQAPTVSTSASATSNPATSSTSSLPAEPLHDSVVVNSPQPNATVGQTFTVSGEAPGPWYFEAVFPIKVVDANDNTIGNAQGQAESDWTTDAEVPFTATISLSTTTPYHGAATLVLLKDNESGLPENDDSVSIPIVVQ